MTQQAYNGWTNYPTWNVHLWLSNDQYSDEAIREIVHNPAYTLGIERDDAIREFVVEYMYDESVKPSGIAADLLDWALSQVNWREITENYLSK